MDYSNQEIPHLFLPFYKLKPKADRESDVRAKNLITTKTHQNIYSTEDAFH
jgi:hypothetical protein